MSRQRMKRKPSRYGFAAKPSRIIIVNTWGRVIPQNSDEWNRLQNRISKG